MEDQLKESEILKAQADHLRKMANDMELSNDETVKSIMIVYNDKVTNAPFDKTDRNHLLPAIDCIVSVLRKKADAVDLLVQSAIETESKNNF